MNALARNNVHKTTKHQLRSKKILLTSPGIVGIVLVLVPYQQQQQTAPKNKNKRARFRFVICCQRGNEGKRKKDKQTKNEIKGWLLPLRL